MSLSVLNIGEGDTKLTFDPKKPVERERACRVVTDMLQRGYTILVQIGMKGDKPHFIPISKFDPKTAEYVIADLPAEEPAAAAAPPRRGRGRPRRVSAETTPAVAIPRRAGG